MKGLPLSPPSGLAPLETLIFSFVRTEFVEEESNKIIDYFKNQGILIMGLTTQGLALTTRTINQLRYPSFDRILSDAEEEKIIAEQVTGSLGN